MRLKTIVMATILLLLLIIFILFIFFDRLVICIYSKAYDLDISYKNLTAYGISEFIFEDLKIINKRRGIGFAARHADLKPILSLKRLKSISFKFGLKDARFIKKEGGSKEAYDTLLGLLAVPFKLNVVYKEIAGEIQPVKNGMHITDLVAASDDIKMAFTGTIYNNNYIESSITIYFSQQLATKIPEALSTAVLKDDADNWKSLSIKLRGDHASPSIEVLGSLFRLNINPTSTAKNSLMQNKAKN